MADWKKVIVSGSIAELAQVTASDGFTGSFVGDGSGLTGITTAFPTTPLDGENHGATKFFVNDGTNKFISGSQFTASIFAQVSGDVTIASGGEATITSAGTSSVVDILTHTNGEPDVIFLLGTDTTAGTGERVYALNESGRGVKYTSSSNTIDIAHNLIVGDGDVDGVNSAFLSSSAATFDLLNTTVTTLNIGGESTTVNIGKTGGSLVQVKDNLQVVGDLIVNGDTTTLNTANLNVEDRFILLNSSSYDAFNSTPHGNGQRDGGIIVQTAGTEEVGAYGTALFYNDNAGRWSITPTGSVPWDMGPGQYPSASFNIVTTEVSNTSGVVPTVTPAGIDPNNRYGQMFVDTSDTTNGGLYIYLPS